MVTTGVPAATNSPGSTFLERITPGWAEVSVAYPSWVRASVKGLHGSIEAGSGLVDILAARAVLDQVVVLLGLAKPGLLGPEGAVGGIVLSGGDDLLFQEFRVPKVVGLGPGQEGLGLLHLRGGGGDLLPA